MNPNAARDLEATLDRHGAFVRRLARTLVLDESRADDVVQETWLAAARHPPRDGGSARSWLARVVRNFAFRAHRDDGRRSRREERVARPEGSPRSAAPQEALLLREVIDAVLALDEPYRSTVLMRFYENFEPSEIAARLGIPAATVRTRLKRALDQLRERFDAAHGGNRHAWVAPLAPFALGALGNAAATAAAAAAGEALASAGSITHVTIGGMLMAKKIGIIGGIVAAAVVTVVIATRPWDEGRDDGAPPLRPFVAEGAAIEAAPGPIVPTGIEPISAKPYVPTDEDREVPEIALAAQGTPSATVTGRVVDRDGAPLVDVPVSLKTSRRVAGGQAHDDVRDERQLQARTGPAGRFEFTRLPIGIRAEVSGRPDRLCDVARAAEVSKPGVLDLGDLVAQPGGSVAGVVMGPQGTPVRNCRVRAWPVERPSEAGPHVIGFRSLLWHDARAATTNAAGQFRIDGLPDGTCTVMADPADLAGGEKTGVRVRTNEVTWEVDFRLDAGATLAGWVRDTNGAPLAGAVVKASAAELRIEAAGGAQGSPRSATTGADGRFVIQGLRDEPLTVRARKPGYIVEVARDTTPGSELTFRLRPCGMAWGRVRNAVTGEAIPEYSARVVADLFERARSRVVRGKDAAAAAGVPDEAGLFAILDLSEDPFEIHVEAAQFADRRVGPVRVEAGGKLEVPVLLSPGATVRGIVVDAAGAPVEGASVSITNEPHSEAGPVRAVRFRRRVVSRNAESKDEPAPVGRSAVTTRDGTFVIASLPAGEYRLTASHRTHAPGEPVDVALAAGETRTDVRLAVQAAGTLAGRTLAADGSLLAGARVTIRPRTALVDLFGDLGGEPAISDARGEFEIAGLSPGEYLASVAEPSAGRHGIHFAMASRDATPSANETPVTIEAGETTRVDLRLRARARLSGVVRDGGKPAVGLRVALGPQGLADLFGHDDVRTDTDGSFVFEKVAPGDYALTVRPPGAPVPVSRTITLEPAADARVTIDLPTGAIEGRVTERGTGKPLAGVTVTANVEREADGEPVTVEATAAIMIASADDGDDVGGARITIGGASEPVVTDSDGKFRLAYLGAGKYRLAIRGNGVMQQSRRGVVVEEGRTTKEIDFGAEKGARLVVAVDAGGQEVSDVFGFLALESEPQDESVSTGSLKQGIVFEGLRPGRYRLRVEAPMDELEGTTLVEVAGGAEVRTTVRLSERP